MPADRTQNGARCVAALLDIQASSILAGDHLSDEDKVYALIYKRADDEWLFLVW